jgi:xanthine/CO dehydrogenase XdhC/CoxF family maturation factor
MARRLSGRAWVPAAGGAAVGAGSRRVAGPTCRWPGCCVSCPPLAATGLVKAFEATYGRLRNGRDAAPQTDRTRQPRPRRRPGGRAGKCARPSAAAGVGIPLRRRAGAGVFRGEGAAQDRHRMDDVDEQTVICVLTHDPRFEVPLLELALQTPARYVGAMGSRRTHDDRLRRLGRVSVCGESLARLSSPIGLDLGARTPLETGVAIAAEFIALIWGGSGRRRAGTNSAVH